MKPFYRVLTYLVLIIQSFIILLLLTEKQQDTCTYAAKAPAATAPKRVASVTKEDKGWEITAISRELLLFKFYHCKR